MMEKEFWSPISLGNAELKEFLSKELLKIVKSKHYELQVGDSLCSTFQILLDSEPSRIRIYKLL